MTLLYERGTEAKRDLWELLLSVNIGPVQLHRVARAVDAAGGAVFAAASATAQGVPHDLLPLRSGGVPDQIFQLVEKVFSTSCFCFYELKSS